MKTIPLEFPPTMTGLAHNPYGREIYDKQVAGIIDFEGENTIIFPPQIKRVSASFVQGFFNSIVSKIGYDGLKNHIIIKSEVESDDDKDKLVRSIYDNLY